ncbi:uncharacterized protein PHALS_10369 [Plasmopara halstedii]|uniref:Uncharacterized protein n=1 Tax=Plasmopara halstedii TaxID=4781 RepID=A0A0P1AHH2_PLAHL|nr:uncharacterized protein PHALS_10369 [Plasmopara halstedii]CEG40156.1 hypothetical protein PHALS_10369 [Plasmopara halstedii]|eukprot:XP_024576525.1 hypothetical protein PHALS_10369 [Plasmopara halstedii]
MLLDFTKPDILENDDFKRLVKYEVLWNFSRYHSSIQDTPVWKTLKTRAKTDKGTLIERLKQATIVKATTPWQVRKVIEYYSTEEDYLIISAWADYVSTLDFQPLDSNVATIFVTIYTASELDSLFENVFHILEADEEDGAIRYPLLNSVTDAEQKLATLTNSLFNEILRF